MCAYADLTQFLFWTVRVACVGRVKAANGAAVLRTLLIIQVCNALGWGDPGMKRWHCLKRTIQSTWRSIHSVTTDHRLTSTRNTYAIVPMFEKSPPGTPVRHINPTSLFSNTHSMGWQEVHTHTDRHKDQPVVQARLTRSALTRSRRTMATATHWPHIYVHRNGWDTW